MKAIIMAGGEGTRLRPLTCNTPKPMMSIMDKPVMEYTIQLLKRNGIIDIGVTVQYLPDEIISYFGDGKNFGVNIKYFIEEFPLGTAGSVKNAEDFLDDTFIVISGDALTDIELSKAIKYHKDKKSIATLVLKEVPVPLEYGVVVTDKEGSITGFLEKPSWSEVFSDKVNTGIYILEPSIFSYFERNQKFDFSNDLFPILLREKRPMYGYVAEGYWCDIGNIEQYMKCHFDILKGLVKVDIKGKQYKEGIWIGENCEISPKAKISAPTYIGNGCKVYDLAEIGPYSIFGKNTIISFNSTIKRSIAFNNCYIGNNVEIRGGVLCKNVQVESNVSIFEGATIGDDTLVKGKSIIKPNVKIWPNKVVDSGTVVKSNVIWGGKFSNSLFGKCGISGEVNVDITPEFVSKLGSAYGSVLKPDSKVAVSCGEDEGAQMFKYALVTGLLSMGIEVYDLKKMTMSMTRKATLFFGVNGSIHVDVDIDNKQKVNIYFMDNNGLNIDKTLERKIQNSFIREDFRRVKTDNLKKITNICDCIQYYKRRLLNELNIDKIKSHKYKIILSVKNPIILKIMKNILSELKVDIKIYDKYNDLIGIKKEVMYSDSNLGICILDNGDKAIMIDEKGNIIRDNFYDALNALILLKTTKFKTLVVPVTSSCILEEIAKMCGAKFIRTKTSQKNILNEYIKNEESINKKNIVNMYLETLDTVRVCLSVLNLMASTNVQLSQISSKIPKYYTTKHEIKCPWNMKGKLMRNLIEKNTSNSVDLIEGVKLNYDSSWALVLPDADEPLCKVYVESKDIKQGKNLSYNLIKKIKNITR